MGIETIIGDSHLLGRHLWQSKRDKIIKIQAQGCKSIKFAHGRVQKVNAANLRVQKYSVACGRVQKVKPANSRVQKLWMYVPLFWNGLVEHSNIEICRIHDLCTFAPLSLQF